MKINHSVFDRFRIQNDSHIVLELPFGAFKSQFTQKCFFLFFSPAIEIEDIYHNSSFFQLFLLFHKNVVNFFYKVVAPLRFT